MLRRGHPRRLPLLLVLLSAACWVEAQDALASAEESACEDGSEPEAVLFVRAALWSSKLVPKACDSRGKDGCDWLSIAVTWRYAWNNLRLAVEVADRTNLKRLGSDVRSQLGRLHDLMDRLGDDPGLWYANWHQAAGTARELVSLLSDWLAPKARRPGCHLKPKRLAVSRWNHGLRFPQFGRSVQVPTNGVSTGRTFLGNDAEMPLLGLVLRPSPEAYEFTRLALDCGLRFLYMMEATGALVQEVLRALLSSEVPRGEVFLAGNVRASGLREQGASLRAQLHEALGSAYLDALALAPAVGESEIDPGSWKELEALYKQGEVNTIGVSGVSPESLLDLFREADLKPRFVQSKFTVYEPGGPDEARRADSQMEWLTEHGVVTVGLGLSEAGGCGYLQPLQDPHIVAVSQQVGRSVVQVINRWFLQLGGTVLLDPGRRREDLKDNLEVFRFSLDEAEMRRLNGLSSLAASSPGRRAPTWCEDVYGLSDLPFEDAT